uniref:Uncharacterized protein n=4 Tax=Avena sativa TaxID=4498 RepID=A0ACD5Z3C2_AVESA
MKLLQHISLSGCKKIKKLPGSIVNSAQLRYLDFCETSIMGIPRGFSALANLVILRGFPAHVEGDWCSLEELGPLNRLKYLGLHGLENVSASSYAAKAKLGDKVHLSDLFLSCGSKLGDDGLIDNYMIFENKKQQIEKVFDDLCPPPKLDFLAINGYFGRRLPRWMMSSSVVPLTSLRILLMGDLACCTQLPDGLCQLPSLESIQIERAPAIKRIGPEFLHSYHDTSPFTVLAAFPRLRYMDLTGMVEWEEWEWEEQVQAFPVLETLMLKKCKLKCVPPVLGSQVRTLNVLCTHVHGLVSLENFGFLVELQVLSNLDLERITNLPRLQRLTISTCPKLKVVEGVSALQSLFFVDEDMETLPEYMGGINPRHLELHCSLVLLTSIAAGESGPEWDKFSHVEHVKVYAQEGDNPRKWYVLYTASPYNLETNVSRSFMSRGTLSSFEDAQRFESVFKMTRKTFSYICSLVKGPLMNNMDIHTFVDGRVLPLQDEVAVALRRLNSRGPAWDLGYTIGVNESTVLSVTKRFSDALFAGTGNPWSWRDSSKIDNIKSMFAEIHNMHNCCGVICTTNIPFGPEGDHENKENILMQVIVDAKMRFMNILLVPAGSTNQLSLFHACHLFEECNKGAWLNGKKLKVALDGSEVGEYIIGDAGYPLLPWLLTPYQEENFSDSKKEFNRRHSAATTCALKALARLKDTWKYLQEERPVNQQTLVYAIYASCMLHNIVIDMEDDTAMPRLEEGKYYQDVRQLASEDAVRARDMLSQYFLTSRSLESGGTLPSFEDMQRFESVFKMTRKTFNYICSLVFGLSMEDVDSYTFIDGRVMCLEDRVAVALRRLYSSEPSEIFGSCVGVDESTTNLITDRFIAAVCAGAMHHMYWPDSSKMDKMKSMFGRIHNMHNCCGVVCTTHIPFGPNWEHEKNDNILMRAVVDPEMRFMDIWLEWEGSMNWSSILQGAELFEECEKGVCLNGSKLKVALDGSEVGEYLIGDAGYPLLPWLLTPYQKEDLSDSKAEFNKRHTAATTCATKVLAKFQETWKFLQGQTSCPVNAETRAEAIYACCMLHNIVIDMEDDASMRSVEELNYCEEVRQLASEDAVKARDMLSQYFLTSSSSKSGGTLSSFEDAQIFESVFKMSRKTFNYICGLVFGLSMEDISSYTFIDGRMLCLEDRVAVALRRLYSSEPSETLGSSFGVDESTIKLVTDRFVAAVCQRAVPHIMWPDSGKMDKIKSMFGMVHNMHNCCGVICTTHIPFGPTCDHEKNDIILMHVIIDPEMRFMEILLEWEGSMNWSSHLHGFDIFKGCKMGVALNGSKLKVALDGPEVGEYIIGDAGYPLLPWLLTPYQEEDLSDSKAEFNRRHSAATSFATKALARFQETWKFLQGQISYPFNAETLAEAIYACCMLHNIVIDMENDAVMRSTEELNYHEEVRQLADEDAVSARDMLLQYFWTRKTLGLTG